jgi:integrase
MLQSIGFGCEITMSGFRSMAATLLSEQGWNADAIERQLSHLDPRPVRRPYNFAEYLPERRRMMQAWADYLDQLAGRKRK